MREWVGVAAQTFGDNWKSSGIGVLSINHRHLETSS
jgi:hypothetical protein